MTEIYKNLKDLTRKLNQEPGVTGLWLVGSARVKTPSPQYIGDVDIVVNLQGQPKGEEFILRDKYQGALVYFRGKYLPIDLHINSTNVPEEEWLDYYNKFGVSILK